MAFDKDALIEQIGNLTVLELVELVDGLKDKLGVEAVAPMPMGMPMGMPGAAPSGGDEPAAEEKTEFDVVIKSPGDEKLKVIKEVRALTGAALKEAKTLVESGGTVKEGISKDEAEEIKKKLEGVGATIEVK